MSANATIVPVEIAARAAVACATIERHLGISASRHLGISAATLQAIHVFGSAFDGESKPHGDIDLPVTIGASPRDAVRRAPMSDLLDVSPLPGGATRCAYRT